MAQEGKKSGKAKFVVIAIVVVVLLGAIGSMAGGASDNGAQGGAQPDATTGQPASEEPSAEQPSAEEQEPYTVTDEQLDASNPYATYITGTLTNTTDNEVSYIQVEYNLYDADGAQIGTALANTNNLKAGGVWKFEAIGTASPDEVASFELVDVTGF